VVKNGYWRQFFDKWVSREERNIPNFPTMRERLIEGLLSTESLGLSPNALTITRPEALELAAICMKSAYSGMLPESDECAGRRMED
jgi:hypothetical protein